MAKRYIGVAGNIGVGKTSLVDFLCRHFGLEAVFEPNESNPYLADFYKDMKKWAFHSQAYFLARKFRLHRQVNSSPQTVVQDRTIYEDAEVFARNLYETRIMKRRDFETYWELYENIRNSLEPPDIMIYLRASMRTVRRRIKLRGREMEQNIPLRYLKRLDALYERWFDDYDLSPVMTLRTDKLDYISDIVARLDLLKEIEQHLK